MNTPKYSKLDATVESKALVQAYRNRFDVSEKQLVEGILRLAQRHEAQLLSICESLLSEKKPAAVEAVPAAV